MIRVGGYTEENGNVLEGTLFQQIGRPMNITVRAKAILQCLQQLQLLRVAQRQTSMAHRRRN